MPALRILGSLRLFAPGNEASALSSTSLPTASPDLRKYFPFSSSVGSRKRKASETSCQKVSSSVGLSTSDIAIDDHVKDLDGHQLLQHLEWSSPNKRPKIGDTKAHANKHRACQEKCNVGEENVDSKPVVADPAFVKFKASTMKLTSAKLDGTSKALPSDLAQHQGPSNSFTKFYDIKEKLGVGGGGVVYAGTRKSDNVDVAIKKVSKRKVNRWGKLDGRVVLIEFELLHRAAGNKGTIKMYEWFERRSSYILVMERPQPVIDLFDYLNKNGPMSESLARKTFRQIVSAVNHFHADGIIHRDIKDENILLNPDTLETKIIDFGCATFARDKPFTKLSGTEDYYPPEWFANHCYDGKKLDAWSLGVLLYIMVEAEVPFPTEADIIRCEYVHKQLTGSLGANCRDLIALMLQKNQDKRLSLEEVLKHLWFTEE